MRTLPELQTEFASAVLREDAPAIIDEILSDGLAPAARVRVYRNHVFSSLTEVLEATYPVVCRLVDRRFFGYAADRYIRCHPPAGPCLFEYGQSLPEFLSSFPSCAEYPYLPDVARLEWAMNRALHAEDVVPITPADLATVSADHVERLTLALDPSAAWLRSGWPVDRIWHANQPDANPEASVDLAAGGVMLEIRRRDDTVSLRRLETGEFTFRTMLGQGSALRTAADTALAEEPGFDLTMALRALLAEALLTSVRVLPEASPEGDSR